MLDVFAFLVEPEQVFELDGYKLTPSGLNKSPFSSVTDNVSLTVCVYPKGDSSKDIHVTLKCLLHEGSYQFQGVELEALEAGGLDDAVTSLQIAMKWFRQQPWYAVIGG